MPGPEGSLINVSENRLDFFVLENTYYKKNGYFVDIGAADGVIGSNTFILEKFYNWNGICVDPNPNLIEKLAGSRDSQICSLCVWRDSGKILNFSYPESPEFVGWNFRAGVESVIEKNSQNFISQPVFTISLSDLLLLYNAPKEIDYMSLDVEGSEFDILENFNFSDYKIKIISVEHDFDVQREKIYNLLISKNYTRFFTDNSINEDIYFLNIG